MPCGQEQDSFLKWVHQYRIIFFFFSKIQNCVCERESEQERDLMYQLLYTPNGTGLSIGQMGGGVHSSPMHWPPTSSHYSYRDSLGFIELMLLSLSLWSISRHVEWLPLLISTSLVDASLRETFPCAPRPAIPDLLTPRQSVQCTGLLVNLCQYYIVFFFFN